MNYNSRSVAMESIPKLCERGVYDFTHPLQRSAGQWSRRQKSDLIDSIFRNFHIDAVSLARDGKKFYVIDGIQRLTTIRDFMDGKLKLSERLEVLPDGTVIAGKRFDDLSEELKLQFGTRNLDTVQMTDYTDEELREVFRRKNNGKPLTAAQKHSVKYSPELYKTIIEVTDLDQADEKGKPVKNFWNRVVTKGIRKNSEDRNLVMQSLMLMDGNMQAEDGIKCGFQAVDIEAYIDRFLTYSLEEQNALVDRLNEAAGALNEQFEQLDQQVRDSRKALRSAQEGEDTSGCEERIHTARARLRSIKKLTIPMLVAGMGRALEKQADKDAYMERVYRLLDFLNDMQDKNREERAEQLERYSVSGEYAPERAYYQHYNTSGTASRENVNGRWQVFQSFSQA
ncbi:DUF262 domain-containing protein [bacterium 1XD42-94]|nr:DUF262 domain-containing protein [bacterium 1XD42-76]NBK05456.1 DUF262 domain-containing protein [bacterium 1XD42-94]